MLDQLQCDTLKGGGGGGGGGGEDAQETGGERQKGGRLERGEQDEGF